MSVSDFVRITLFILLLNGQAFFVNRDWFTIVVFLITYMMFRKRNCHFDKGFFWVLGVWLAINVISLVVNHRMEPFTFIGYTMKMCIPYFLIKVMKESFFEKFFNYSYILVLISSIFYIIEVALPDIVNALVPYLNFLVEWRMKANGDFYLFVYTHLGHYQEYYGPFPRNCGFMWEPGAYSFVLIFMIAYYINKYGYKLDSKLTVLILAEVTTFSTAGYGALFVIILLYVLRNRKIRKSPVIMPILLVGFLMGAVYLFNNADFMSEKLLEYEEKGTDVGTQRFEGEEWERVTRLGMAVISLENAFVHPWGDGVLLSNYIINKYGSVSAPGALSTLLRGWGWLGLLFFFYSLWQFTPNKGKKMGALLVFTFTFVVFSNPYDRCRYLMHAILFYSLVCHNFISQENKQLSEYKIESQ